MNPCKNNKRNNKQRLSYVHWDKHTQEINIYV